ncbi:glycosyltransferase [Psittacicella gerlachiana]|uniref:Fucosyltransferase C-terminal domain-containing protein n=1 Tax=Psittacicella gerlachiana TaxID=2028574 RepID=A0A3A1YKX0_9GAMM|nr:glycosyltransferase family 10 [Psittacicella gerlachiana]RIY37859.1 hypothetical protein CKF59_01380 [Psittacicella gerlachiana]
MSRPSFTIVNSRLVYTGFWHDFVLAESKQMALVHKFNFPKKLLLVQQFAKRGLLQAALESYPSALQQTHALAPQFFTDGPLPYLDKYPEFTGGAKDFFSVYHGQEHNYLFSFTKSVSDYLADYVDLVAGPYLPQVLPTLYGNYFHIPNYFRSSVVGLHTLYGLPTLAQVEELIAQLEQTKKDYPPAIRKVLGVCIARHDQLQNMVGVRGKICDIFTNVFGKMSKYPIVYPSTFRFNSSEMITKFNDDKIAYARNFIFMICPENSSAPGYVSEKIFEAMAAGCIPIYWGGIETELDYINAKAFLHFDPKNEAALGQELVDLWNNKEKFAQLCAEPYFLPGAAARIYLRYVYPFAKYLTKLLGAEVNLYSCLKTPQATDLEAEKAKAQAQLASLGLQEDKYLYLLDEANNFPYQPRVPELTPREQETLARFIQHYQ